VDIAYFQPTGFLQARKDGFGGHARLDRQSGAGFESPGYRGQEFAGAGWVEIAEAVSETESPVEFLAPRELAHVGEDPFCGKGGAFGLGFGDEFFTKVDAGNAVTSLRELDRVASIAAGDVQQVGRLRYAQGFLQEAGLGAGLFGRHGEATHIQRNAAEKI